MHRILVPALVAWSSIAGANPLTSARATKTRTTLGRLGLRRPAQGPFKPSGSYDESIFLLKDHQVGFRQWQQSARRVLAVGSRRVPVTVVEVGSALRPKPTILHFHGAQVGTDDILFYRLANGFKAAGKPIRIISAEWEDAEAVLEQLHQTTGQKVAVMGHSAGGHVASLLARRHGDKVSHFVSLDVPGFMPGNVPSLLVAGTASDYANRALEKTVAGDDRTTVVRIPMADLNLRARPPETLPLFEPHQKPALNSSPESARVAADVAGHIHRFLEGAPHDSGLLKKLKAQPAR